MGLVIVHVGPVQRFISQARRTHDLYVGSFLLSRLVYAGMCAIPRQDHIYPLLPESIFPLNKLLSLALTDEQLQTLRLPNRFIFRAEDPVAAGEQVEQAILSYWWEIAETIWQVFTKMIPDSVTLPDKTVWDQQVISWPEIYWVALNSNGDDPKEVAEAGAALAARKLLRDIHRHAERGEKSTLSGTAEALYPEYNPEKSPTRKDLRNYWGEIQKALRNPALLRDGEQLSAIDIIKRFAHEVDEKGSLQRLGLGVLGRFPSTSSIAVAPFREWLLRHWQEVHNVTRHYIETLETLNVMFTLHEPYPYLESAELQPIGSGDLLRFDGDFFFPETLRLKVINDYSRLPDGNKPTVDAIATAQTSLKRLRKAAEAVDAEPFNGTPKPPTYYAILMLDGDGIGNILQNQLQSIAHYQAFSAALAQFAANYAPRIVEGQFAGRLVYSGGDDVLALLPMKDALICAHHLQAEFQAFIAEQVDGLFVTASAGIAIAHHTHPLDLVLEAARRAEKDAKKVVKQVVEISSESFQQSGVVCVRTLKRSGEHQEAFAFWDAPIEIAEFIEEMRRDFVTENLGRKLPFDLQELAYQVDGEIEIPEKAQESLLKRILERRAQSANFEKQVHERYHSKLLQLSKLKGWENVARWVQLALFMAQGDEA